jgi:hypothetical protein
MTARKQLIAVTTLFLFCFTLASCVRSANVNPSVSFSELIGHPEKYNGKTVTVEGFYFRGFEIVALCGLLGPSQSSPGNQAPDTELVWLEGSLPDAVNSILYEQNDVPTGYPQYFAKIKVTGLFETGSSYGHLNGYKYQLTIYGADLIPWTPYGTLQVLILDGNGIPVPGAKVVSDEQPEGQLKVTGGTNSEGMVTYRNLRPGTYRFYTTSIEYKEFDVVVTVGEEVSITIKLEATISNTTSTPPPVSSTSIY